VAGWKFATPWPLRFLIVLLALVLLAYAVTPASAQHGPVQAVFDPPEGTTPPDTLDATRWINSTKGVEFDFHSWAALWMTGEEEYFFNSAADDLDAALKIGNGSVCDSSIVSPLGYWTGADSLVITRMAISGDLSTAGLPEAGCNIELFQSVLDDSTISLLSVSMVARAAMDSTKMLVLVAPGAMLNARTTIGFENRGIDKPVVRFWGRGFYRP